MDRFYDLEQVLVDKNLNEQKHLYIEQSHCIVDHSSPGHQTFHRTLHSFLECSVHSSVDRRQGLAASFSANALFVRATLTSSAVNRRCVHATYFVREPDRDRSSRHCNASGFKRDRFTRKSPCSFKECFALSAWGHVKRFFVWTLRCQVTFG